MEEAGCKRTICTYQTTYKTTKHRTTENLNIHCLESHESQISWIHITNIYCE